ncbi:hypothetical protein Scep_002653 [Stephania cephalantha]|uniref:Uncharacterized protein n=1 Tax=Stephania cephalantha TaxID=152367 RepID=A0AAP0LBY7_9MAGN
MKTKRIDQNKPSPFHPIFSIEIIAICLKLRFLSLCSLPHTRLSLIISFPLISHTLTLSLFLSLSIYRASLSIRPQPHSTPFGSSS